MKSRLYEVFLRLIFIVCLFIMPVELDAQKRTPILNDGQLSVENEILELLMKSEREYDIQKALQYSEEALFLADSINVKSLCCKALRINASAWKKWGDPYKAIEKLSKALTIGNETNNQDEVAMVYLEIGEAYRAMGSHLLANENFYRALSLLSVLNDSAGLAVVYNRLSANYFERFFNYPAFNTLFKSNQLNEDTLNRLLAGEEYLKNLSDSLTISLNLSDALASKLELTDISISNKTIYAAWLNSIGRRSEALHIYKELLVTLGEQSYHPDLPLVLINTGWLYRYSDQADLAIECGEKAMLMAQKNKILRYVMMANELLESLYAEKGDYYKAYSSLQVFNKARENILKADFELRLQVAQLEQKSAQRESELNLQKLNFQYSVIVSVVIILLLVVFSLILIGQLRKKRVLLKALNEKNLVISRQNEELFISNAEKDKFFSIIAHDLKTPFNAILGFSQLLLEEVRERKIKELEEYADLVMQSSVSAHNLLDNLLEWSRSKTGRISFAPMEHNLQQMVSEVTAMLKNAAEQKGISLKTEIDGQTNVFCDASMIDTVMRNLISNSIKFTGFGGEITIAAKGKNGVAEISVKDSGVGMNQKQIEALFDISQNQTTKGTHNETGTGLGLILSKEFIEKHGQKIWVESEPGKGSTFYFTLNLRK